MSNTTPYTPFRVPHISRENVEEIFGPKANGQAASRLYQENRDLYERVRAEAVHLGILSERPENAWAVQQRKAELKMHPEFTSEEIAARAAFSEQDCRRLLGKGADDGKNELVEMKTTAPNKYQVFRAAAKSYGLIGDSVVIDRTFKPNAQPTDDGKFVLSDELAAKVNLPRGSRVSQEQFESVLKLIAEKNEGEKE